MKPLVMKQDNMKGHDCFRILYASFSFFCSYFIGLLGRKATKLIGCRCLLGNDDQGIVEHKHQASFLYPVYCTAVSARATLCV